MRSSNNYKKCLVMNELITKLYKNLSLLDPRAFARL